MSNNLEDEPEAIRTFRNWFTSNGGEIHPSVRFCPGAHFVIELIDTITLNLSSKSLIR